MLKNRRKVLMPLHVDEKWIDWYQDQQENYRRKGVMKQKQRLIFITASAAVLLLGLISGIFIKTRYDQYMTGSSADPAPVTITSGESVQERISYHEARKRTQNLISFEEPDYPQGEGPSEELKEFVSLYFTLIKNNQKEYSYTFIEDEQLEWWQTYYAHEHEDAWEENRGKNRISRVIYEDDTLIAAEVKFEDLYHLLFLSEKENEWHLDADIGRSANAGTYSIGLAPAMNLRDYTGLVIYRNETLYPLSEELIEKSKESIKEMLFEMPLSELISSDDYQDLADWNHKAPNYTLRHYVPYEEQKIFNGKINVRYIPESSFKTLREFFTYGSRKIKGYIAAFAVDLQDIDSLTIEGYEKEVSLENRVYVCWLTKEGKIDLYVADDYQEARKYLQKIQIEK